MLQVGPLDVFDGSLSSRPLHLVQAEPTKGKVVARKAPAGVTVR